MSDTDDLEREIAALKSELNNSTLEVKKLSKQKVYANKIRVDCKGPGEHRKCAYNSFEFFPKVKVFWRCKRCWKLNVEEDKQYKPIQEIEAKLEKYTKHWETGPDGHNIRIGWDNKPVEKKYWEWWERQKIKSNELPAGYYWCTSYNRANKESENACTACPRRSDCGRHLIDAEKRRLKELERKQIELQKELKPFLEKSKVVSPVKTLSRKEVKQQKKIDKNKLLDSLINQITKPVCVCGNCKIEFSKGDTFWAFNGFRWIRQFRGTIELDNPQKRRCNICKKGEK